MWDTAQYLRFGDERARPFYDLLARLGADKPGLVIDMGCGPGNLTVSLAERWSEDTDLVRAGTTHTRAGGTSGPAMPPGMAGPSSATVPAEHGGPATGGGA